MDQPYPANPRGDNDPYHDIFENSDTGPSQLPAQGHHRGLNNNVDSDQDPFFGAGLFADFDGFGEFEFYDSDSQGQYPYLDQFFLGGSQFADAASQGDFLENGRGSQGDFQSEGAASEGAASEDTASEGEAIEGAASEDAASEGDVSEGDLNQGEASQGDVEQDDQGNQDDSQIESADDTPVQPSHHYGQRFQRLAALELPQAPPQVEGQAGPVVNYQEDINNMKAGGIYRGLLLNQAQYFSVNRISDELKELTRGGSVLIEMSDIEMQYWVGRLFLAFKNIEGIHDKKCKNGKPAQAAARLNANYYPDKEIEKACWRIVSDCAKCANGIRLVEPHHAARVEQYATFAERMEKILYVCKTSKAACKQLLDPPYHLRLIDAPNNEAFVKESNRRLNHKRDIQNMIGRQAMKRQNLKIEDLVVGDEAEDAYELEGGDAGSSFDSNPLKKRTSTTKRQSVSVRTPAKKDRLQLKPEESSPAGPLALKRKRRTISPKNYRQSDEDKTEDSDVSEYKEDSDEGMRNRGSSNKRQAVESSPGISATPTPLAPRLPRKPLPDRRPPNHPVADTLSHDSPQPQVGSQFASPGQANASGTYEMSLGGRNYSAHQYQGPMGSDFAVQPQGLMAPVPVAQVQGSMGFGSTLQPQSFMVPVSVVAAQGANSLNFTGSFVAPTLDSLAVHLPYHPGQASDNGNAGKMKYKTMICEILNVDPSFAQLYTLEELRMYARAYNREFAPDDWIATNDEKKSFKCKTFHLFCHTAGTIKHFTQYFPKLVFLAVERGDLNADGSFNHKGPHLEGFSLKSFTTSKKYYYDQALGAEENPFGRIDKHTLQIVRNESRRTSFPYSLT